MGGKVHHTCGSTSQAKIHGMYSVRFLRRHMWLQHLGVVLDLVVKVLSGSVPLVTGKMSWRPAEDSSSYTSDELEYLNWFQAVLLWTDAE